MSTHILFGFLLNSLRIFWKALVIVIPFLSIKGISQAYLLWISITHNKKRKTLLNLLINCITPILFMKGECTFVLLNFRIISLYNSLHNSLLEVLSFLMLLPEVFYQKFINHWSKSTLISIILWLFSNIYILLFKSLNSP